VLISDRPFLGLTLTNMGFSLCSLMFVVGLPVYTVHALHTPTSLPGILFALNTVLLAATQTLVVQGLESYCRTRALVGASGLWCAWAGLIMLALLLPSGALVPYLLVITGVYTLAELMHGPTSNALAAAAGPAAQRARYMAAFQLSWGIASMLAPSVFGCCSPSTRSRLARRRECCPAGRGDGRGARVTAASEGDMADP
jgi:hypothetical protein